MPTYEFTAPDGKTYEVGAPEGATQAQAFEMLQSQLAAGTAPAAGAPSATMSAGRMLNDVPRQLGLTARYAIEGPAQAAQVVTEPIRQLVTDPILRSLAPRSASSLVTGKPDYQSKPLVEAVGGLLDRVGLPKPGTPGERVVGDAARMMAGAAVPARLAGAAADAAGPVTNLTAEMAPAMLSRGQNLLRGLAANPTSQLTAAAGGGLAGGASREAGGGPLQQGGAALIGTVLGGMVPAVSQPLIGAARNLLTRGPTPQQIDVQLSRTLDRAGVDYSQLSEQVRRSLRTELGDALRAGQELDPAAVSRLADFSAVGAQPTRGMLSQNPSQITREQNLAKMAANSSDGELQGLPAMQNRNNQVLIGRLNDLGARTETDPIAAGRLVQGAVRGTRDQLRGAERAAWEEARQSPGYTQPIYADGLSAVNHALGDEGMMGFISPTISRYMEAFQGPNPQPFTPQAYRNLQSMLAGEMAKGGNEAAAAGIARRALEASPMRPVTNSAGVDFGTAPVTPGLAAALRSHDEQAGNAIAAVDRARAATRAAYQYEESSPLVRTALSDARTADPENLARSFVLNGSVNDAQAVAREVGPAGRETIRDALATYIKRQAVSGASDEVGKVSQSRLNATLNKIGEEKLRLFFSPEEVAQLRSVGRVASLMQSQPVGSAVNNSNSGALLLGRGLDALAAASRLGPLGKAVIAEPVQQWRLSVGTNQAQNVGPGLLRAPNAGAPPGVPLLLPGAAAAGGLLAAP